MNIAEYAKESYVFELSRRDELRSAMGLPIGLGVVLSGGLYAVISEFEPLHSDGSMPLFLVGLFGSIALCSLALMIYQLIKSHIGYEYAYAPTAKKLLDYQQNLAEHYKSRENEFFKKAESVAASYLVGEFANNAHRNFSNNNLKSKFLHTASIYLSVAMIFTILTAIASII